jgi:hypothetical protein
VPPITGTRRLPHLRVQTAVGHASKRRPMPQAEGQQALIAMRADSATWSPAPVLSCHRALRTLVQSPFASGHAAALDLGQPRAVHSPP